MRRRVEGEVESAEAQLNLKEQQLVEVRGMSSEESTKTRGTHRRRKCGSWEKISRSQQKGREYKLVSESF